MHIVINMSEEQYNNLIKHYDTFPAEWKKLGLQAIRDGVVLPKGATNGDVIMALFPNAKIEHGLYGLDKMPLICLKLDTMYCTYVMSFVEDLWNAPYKAESEES